MSETSESSSAFDWLKYKNTLKEAIYTLPHFLKNPVEGMRNLPHWDWPTLLTFQGAMAVICGFLMDVVQRHWLAAIVSIFVAPLVGIIANGIMSGFFFFTFMFFFKN